MDPREIHKASHNQKVMGQHLFVCFCFFQFLKTIWNYLRESHCPREYLKSGQEECWELTCERTKSKKDVITGYDQYSLTGRLSFSTHQAAAEGTGDPEDVASQSHGNKWPVHQPPRLPFRKKCAQGRLQNRLHLLNWK